MSQSPLLEINDLRLTLYPISFIEKPRLVLDGVSFSIPKGHSLAILGRTSAGKSMLLRAITRFFHDLPVRDFDGEVLFEGKNLLKITRNKLLHIRGSRIAHVLQNAHQDFNPQLTVKQHFESLLKFNRPRIKKRIDHAIKYLYMVGLVDPEAVLLQRTYPEELDIAERQKIMIASALACEPKVLVADEPTAEFDSGSVARIVQVFEELKRERGMSVIIATGRVRRAEQFGDKISVLEYGELVESAGPKELFERAQHDATRAFVDGTLLAGHDRERLVSHYYH